MGEKYPLKKDRPAAFRGKFCEGNQARESCARVHDARTIFCVIQNVNIFARRRNWLRNSRLDSIVTFCARDPELKKDLGCANKKTDAKEGISDQVFQLRNVDNQIFAAERKIGPSSAFHIFRRGLRERRDDDR